MISDWALNIISSNDNCPKMAFITTMITRRTRFCEWATSWGEQYHEDFRLKTICTEIFEVLYV